MKKLLLFFLGTMLLVSSEISPIISVSKKEEITIVKAEHTTQKVGQDALIVRELSTGDSIIGFSCEVVDVDEKIATLECKEFNGLEQEAMPKISFEAKKGDRVIFSPLSNRATIISRSQEEYLRVKKRLQGYQLIHPDLLAVTLYNDDNPFPNKEEFQKFCKRYYISKIVFDFSTKIEIFNCKTFKKVESLEKSVDSSTEVIKPFFHRLAKVENSFWDFGKEEIDDFDSYYEGVINAK